MSEACEIIKVVTIVPASFERSLWCNVCPPYMGQFFQFEWTLQLHFQHNNSGKMWLAKTRVAKTVVAKCVWQKLEWQNLGWRNVGGKLWVAKCEWRNEKWQNVDSGKLWVAKNSGGEMKSGEMSGSRKNVL